MLLLSFYNVALDSLRCDCSDCPVEIARTPEFLAHSLLLNKKRCHLCIFLPEYVFSCPAKTGIFQFFHCLTNKCRWSVISVRHGKNSAVLNELEYRGNLEKADYI